MVVYNQQLTYYIDKLFLLWAKLLGEPSFEFPTDSIWELRKEWQDSKNAHMIIKENIIINNDYGINAHNFHESIFEGNIITNNDRIGIQIGSSSSNIKIRNNNFIFNSRHATFENSENLSWDGNYWGRPRLLPYPIFGRRGLIPWIEFDYNPATEPYDIPSIN